MVNFIPSKNGNEPEKKPERAPESLFSEIGHLFGWIAETITEQAKEPSPGHHPLKTRHEISRLKRSSEVIDDATAVMQNLQFFKEQLIDDFGVSAHAFITKSIDPMILNAMNLIKELKTNNGDEGEAFSTLLEQAVQSVELYSQFSDEKKLKRKIINEALQSTKEAIQKDCQMLKHYQQHSLHESREAQKEELSVLLDGKLVSIFQEFQQLVTHKTDINDLRDLFIWKSRIDEKRNALTELGLLAIDTMLSSKLQPVVFVMEEEESDDPEELAFSALEKGMAVTSSQLTFLTNLEERALKLFELLEDVTTFHPEIFVEIEKLLSDFRVQASDIVKDCNKDPSIQNAFEGVLGYIEKTEQLLEQKRNEAISTEEPPCEGEWFS